MPDMRLCAECTPHAHEKDWPVHIVVLQFARNPDTDDPINWPWTTMLNIGTPVDFVTGGVLGTVDPEELT